MDREKLYQAPGFILLSGQDLNFVIIKFMDHLKRLAELLLNTSVAKTTFFSWMAVIITFLCMSLLNLIQFIPGLNLDGGKFPFTLLSAPLAIGLWVGGPILGLVNLVVSLLSIIFLVKELIVGRQKEKIVSYLFSLILSWILLTTIASFYQDLH